MYQLHHPSYIRQKGNEIGVEYSIPETKDVVVCVASSSEESGELAKNLKQMKIKDRKSIRPSDCFGSYYNSEDVISKQILVKPEQIKFKTIQRYMKVPFRIPSTLAIPTRKVYNLDILH
jgi:hypothetical protein